MKKTLFLMGLCYACLASAETVIPTTAQTRLDVTIYNSNRALIKDERQVALSKGINELAFAGVSARMTPQSAILSGKGLTTHEQNFNFDLLNQESLLQKSVGQTVHTEYIDPNGKVKNATATLLAYNNGRPVLKMGGKIETNYPGRILFDKVPNNLRAEPTLIVSVDSENEGMEPVQLDYLTSGLSWNADYVARLDADEKLMNLNGFVTLTNSSGTDYNNAQLQLVAGDVNMVREERLYKDAASKGAVMAMAMNSTPMVAESLSDFYIYTVPHKTTLLSNQTKQVALLSGTDIGVNKTYELNNAFSIYMDEIKKVKPHIYLTFKNVSENKLGVPLPKGVVRLYKQDAKGRTQFVGEDRINHTADNETVRLKMGEAFNLTGDMKRVSFNKISDRISTAAFEITLKNGGEIPALIEIKQDFPNGYKLLEQNVEGEKLTSNQMKWKVQVPAKGEAQLTYKIRWGD